MKFKDGIDKWRPTLLYLFIVSILFLLTYAYLNHLNPGIDYFHSLLAFVFCCFIVSLTFRYLLPLNKEASDFCYYSLAILATAITTLSESEKVMIANKAVEDALTVATFDSNIEDLETARAFLDLLEDNRSLIIQSSREKSQRYFETSEIKVDRNSCDADLERDIYSARNALNRSSETELREAEERSWARLERCQGSNFGEINKKLSEFLNGNDHYFEDVFYFLPIDLTAIGLAEQEGTSFNFNRPSVLSYILTNEELVLMKPSEIRDRIEEIHQLIFGTFGSNSASNLDGLTNQNVETDHDSLAIVSIQAWLPFALIGLLSIKIANGRKPEEDEESNPSANNGKLG